MQKQDLVGFKPKEQRLICQGEWTQNNADELKRQLTALRKSIKGPITIDGKAISKMDSACAWLLVSEINDLESAKINVELIDFSKKHQKVLSLINKDIAYNKIPPGHKLNAVAKLGKYTIFQLREIHEYLSFVGELTFESARSVFRPKTWRLPTIINTINKTGAQALFIIAVLSFMIGVVISYQMGNQLRNYGANIFIVNLLGLSVLREFGPLITAILVAGRTGSAFTAEIGIMKVNQEIDALATMGISPVGLLLLPRIIGLTIALPLLTIWADIFGIMGGMTMAQNMLSITWYDFLLRFQHEIPLKSLIIGLGKAPLFALIIASIGCFQGIKVYGSSTSVGERTTRSVVLGIFFIIVTDAILSVILSKYKL